MTSQNTRCRSETLSSSRDRTIATEAGIDPRKIRELSTISSWLGGFHIFLEWSMIFLAALACQRFWNPMLYVAVVAFIGARQHALLILMHEGTHYRLFRNRRLNDWVSEIFLAWPHLTTMRSYRRNHIAHHRYLNTLGDPDWTRKKDEPDWQFPKHSSQILLLFMKDLTGLGAISLIRVSRSLAANDPDKSPLFGCSRLAFYAIAALTIAEFGALRSVLLFWLVPFCTWLILIMHIRSIAEHFALDSDNSTSKTRTTVLGLAERCFIAPKNVNYHSEHHAFPSVPFYRLPELHRLMLSSEHYLDFTHLSRGYLAVLRECRSEPLNCAGLAALMRRASNN
jgi:fatty acid desaturase